MLINDISYAALVFHAMSPISSKIYITWKVEKQRNLEDQTRRNFDNSLVYSSCFWGSRSTFSGSPYDPVGVVGTTKYIQSQGVAACIWDKNKFKQGWRGALVTCRPFYQIHEVRLLTDILIVCDLVGQQLCQPGRWYSRGISIKYATDKNKNQTNN